MGCDIHFHSEVKVNGKWEHYSEVGIDREYDLFAKMAGVRNYRGITPISEPKGLPTDISVVTRLDAEKWRDDGHSWSYFNSKEICKLQSWIEDQMGSENSWELERIYWGYIFGSAWNVEKLPPGIEDIRFVFWFDN